jgi:hypothetical protein
MVRAWKRSRWLPLSRGIYRDEIVTYLEREVQKVRTKLGKEGEVS